MPMILRFVIFAGLCRQLLFADPVAASDEDFFESQVRPLLAARCFACHQRKAEGGLRLDSSEGIRKGGSSGPALKPGDAPNSLMWQVVSGNHAEISMPPDKPLADKEVQIIRKWIHDGAMWPEASHELRGGPDANGITDEERRFWSFLPITKPQIPTLPTGPQPENAIDAFVAARRHAAGLSPVARLEPRKLIRRLTYDLTGLPPAPAAIESFVQASEKNEHHAIQDLAARLLTSPRYGERWAQHWLDLVRYADTAGDAADYPVPEAYKYRNYVIEAFNNDLPYDQFVREQLAGDLLPAASPDEMWRRRIATGYIAISRRIGVSPHGLRHITIEDTLNNLGKTFLGLSIGCARCHDHKFDPIPTADYYALYGIFDSTVYPHAGAEHKPYREDFAYRIGSAAADRMMAAYRQQLEPLRREERAAFERYRDFQRKPINIPGYNRDAAWKEVLSLREKIRRLVQTFPDLETAYAVGDAKGHDVRIQNQGNPGDSGSLVRRGFPEILGGQQLPENETQSGRLQLADWVTSADNPLTARVIVNRLWHHHFGRGIVETTSDFGIRGSRPSHPQLLDFLATWMKEHNWSLKQLQLLIVTSETYALASIRNESGTNIDPENVLFWRGNRRRLDAEQIRDSILLASGKLDVTPGGRHPFPHRLTYFYRQHEPFIGNFQSSKRTIYLFRQRIRKNEFLDLFDGPDGNLHVSQRRPTTTSLQSLYFMNSDFIAQHSIAIAQRAIRETRNPHELINWLFTHLLGRLPTEDERFIIVRHARQLQASGDPESAWAGITRSLLSSNEFLFID